MESRPTFETSSSGVSIVGLIPVISRALKCLRHVETLTINKLTDVSASGIHEVIASSGFGSPPSSLFPPFFDVGVNAVDLVPEATRFDNLRAGCPYKSRSSGNDLEEGASADIEGISD